MLKQIAISALFLFPVIAANAQIKKAKGSLYISSGWHQIYYTRSMIHFKDQVTADYDFRLIHAKATGDNHLHTGKGYDAPQWSLRVGWFFNSPKNLGIEINFDHAKYLLTQWQRVRLRGMINKVYYDQDTMLVPEFIAYEHTDGANYYMLNLLKRKSLLTSASGKHDMDLVLKAGAGLVRPRSDTRIMGRHRNDKYHIAGWLAGMEGSLRYELLKNLFGEISLKGVYADYRDVLLYGEGRASQHWWSMHYLFTLAYQFSFWQKK